MFSFFFFNRTISCSSLSSQHETACGRKRILLPRLSFLGALLLPIISSAAIIDKGVYTRDTSTGLDWLDLSETAGLSYFTVSGMLAPGEELEGWRYATAQEADALWRNLGLAQGTSEPVSVSDTTQYNNFVNATLILGNFYPGIASFYDFGASGITGTPLPGFEGSFITVGMYHVDIGDATRVFAGDNGVSQFTSSLFHGSYLVRQVPLPPALWLLLAALGAIKVARLKVPTV